MYLWGSKEKNKPKKKKKFFVHGPLQRAGYMSTEKPIRVEMVLHLVKCLPLIPFKLKSLSLSPWRCQCHPERWMRGANEEEGEGTDGLWRPPPERVSLGLIRWQNTPSLYLVTFIYPGTVDSTFACFLRHFHIGTWEKTNGACTAPSISCNKHFRPYATSNWGSLTASEGVKRDSKQKEKKKFFLSLSLTVKTIVDVENKHNTTEQPNLPACFFSAFCF